MINIFIFAIMQDWLWVSDIWYALPLVVSVSIVYSATRNEDSGKIVANAIRIGLWISAFLIMFSLLLRIINN
jgi:hypothetical protein